MGIPTTSTDAGAGFRQAACPFGPTLRAISSITLSADFSSRVAFGLVAVNADQQLVADAVASRVLLRSAPRAPPSSSLL
jgi:hypothetical protein